MATIRRSGYVQQSKSLDDLIKGQLIYKDARDAEVNRAEEFLEKTDLLEGLKNSEIDSDLYRNYKNWRGELEGQIDSLLNDGRIDFATMGNIRRKYLTDFKHKEDLVKLRNTLVQQQAANYSPYTLYDKDYSKVSIDNMSPDASYRTYRLDDIEKNAFAELSEKYIQTGVPSDSSSDINELLGKIDTEGLTDNQIDIIRDSLNKGYIKAQRSVDEYNKQLERAAKQDEYQKLQMQRLQDSLDKPDGNPQNTFDPKNPTKGLNVYKTIPGNAGDQIPVYKFNKDDKDYYFVMRGKEPIIIPSDLVGEDGSISYSDFYKSVYGEPPINFYDERPYYIGNYGKDVLSKDITDGTRTIIKSIPELREYLGKHPEATSQLVRIAKEKYGVDDIFSSNLLNFKDIDIINNAYGDNKTTAFRIVNKSGNEERFTLIDGLTPKPKEDGNNPEGENKNDGENIQTADTVRTPKPNAGVGNKVYN